MPKLKDAVKAALNYYGIEVSRLRQDPARQRRLELDYEMRITPREPNKRIERTIAAHHALYAQTLDGFLRHKRSFSTIPNDISPDNPELPYWNNSFFFGLDAASLVCIILESRPRVYLEIGSGNSTKFARHAITLGDLKTQVMSVDPAPRSEIDSLCDKIFRVRLEDSDHKIFSILQTGDVLFLDGSHRVFTNSDVAVFFLEILPTLPSGVLVHIHDIFLPFDYPPEWNDRFYSEQYMLAAMLLCRDRPFDIILPNCYVKCDPVLSMAASSLMGETNLRCAQSFWIRTRTS